MSETHLEGKFKSTPTPSQLEVLPPDDSDPTGRTRIEHFDMVNFAYGPHEILQLLP
jgi:hypothetical protein